MSRRMETNPDVASQSIVAADDDAILGTVAWRLLARRSFIARTVAVAILGTLIGSLILPRWYSTTLSFTPQQSRRAPTGNLSGLAAQFGVALPTSEASQSPGFYAQLVVTQAILGSLTKLNLSADSAGASRARPLAELLDVEESDPRREREEVVKELRKRISASAEVRTGVVSINVKMHDPVSSWRLTTVLLNALTGYNLETRQGQARAERKFAERRLQETESELKSAEEALRVFSLSNREMQRSATLALEEQRLQREISSKSQVYQTIVQAYEQARLEEVRDTPVLSIIDQPRIAGRPDSLRLGVRLAIAGVLGLGLAIGLTLFRDLVLRLRKGAIPDTDREALSRRVAHDLARPWRLLLTASR